MNRMSSFAAGLAVVLTGFLGAAPAAYAQDGEALEQVQIAKEAWIEAAKAEGNQSHHLHTNQLSIKLHLNTFGTYMVV